MSEIFHSMSEAVMSESLNQTEPDQFSGVTGIFVVNTWVKAVELHLPVGNISFWSVYYILDPPEMVLEG